MKEFKRDINNCFACPNYVQLRGEKAEVDWCREQWKLIVLEAPNYIIPEWCPLPEKLGT